MLKKLILSLFILLLALMAAGCWDRVEIEDRGFVVGVAIDPADTDIERKGNTKGKRRYLVTDQFVIPAGLQAGAAEGGGREKAYFNLAIQGESMMEIAKILTTRSSRSPYMQHLELIVISGEIIKESLRLQDILDFYIRHPEMRRGTFIAITKDRAKDVLAVENPAEKLPVMYILSVMKNNRETGRMLKPTTIGDIHTELLSGSSYVLPRLLPDQNEVTSAGAAAIRGYDNKLVGWVSAEETEGLNFITGEYKGGIIKVKLIDNLVAYEIQRAKRYIKVDTSDKHRLKVTIEVQTEGMIHESLETENFLKRSTINDLQKLYDQEIVRLCNDTIEKAQNDFKVDVLGLDEHLSANHPRLWEEIKNDWDRGENLFSDCKIEVKSNTIIRNSGVVNQSEKQKD